MPFQIACGECDSCRAGRTGNCDSVPATLDVRLAGGPQTYGGFAADAVNVPYADAMLVPIPDGVEPTAVASLSDNIPDAWRTVAPPLAEAPGSPVLIAMGAGSIALYSVAIAIALGAERVDVVGRRKRDRELAANLGANVLEEEFPDRVGFYPITVDASADPAGLSCALKSTDADGICTSIGIYFQPTEMPLLDMFTQGMTFKTGRPHVRTLMPDVLELVREGRFDPDPMTVNKVSGTTRRRPYRTCGRRPWSAGPSPGRRCRRCPSTRSRRAGAASRPAAAGRAGASSRPTRRRRTHRRPA